MSATAEGIVAITQRGKFAIELAKGLVAFLESGFGGIEIGGGPVGHIFGVGDFAVAGTLVIFGEFFSGVEAGVFPVDSAEIGGEGLPVVVGDSGGAIDVGEAKHGSAKKLVLAVWSLAPGLGDEGFLIAGI